MAEQASFFRQPALIGVAILLGRRETLGRFGRFVAVVPSEIEIAEGEGAV